MSYDPTPTLPERIPPPPAEIPFRQVGISAGTAFKAGFFGFFGAFVAFLMVAIVVGCVLAVLGVGLIQGLSESLE